MVLSLCTVTLYLSAELVKLASQSFGNSNFRPKNSEPSLSPRRSCKALMSCSIAGVASLLTKAKGVSSFTASGTA